MSRRFAGPALVALGLPALVVLGGLALGWWGNGGAPAAPPAPLAATASLSARAISFGDPLTATLEVVVDPRSVDPAGVRVRARFAPYHVVGSNVETRSDGGVLRSYRYELECLEPACVPAAGSPERRFPAAVVSYRAGGHTLTRRVAWPGYRVASRVSAADRQTPAERLRFDAAVPAPSYRVAPGTARAILAALVVVLALAAAGLLVVAFRPRRFTSGAPLLSPLEQALLLVRASNRNGKPADRRRALGFLGRVLRTLDRGELAGDARRLAWSAPQPTAESAEEIASRAEAGGER